VEAILETSVGNAEPAAVSGERTGFGAAPLVGGAGGVGACQPDPRLERRSPYPHNRRSSVRYWMASATCGTPISAQPAPAPRTSDGAGTLVRDRVRKLQDAVVGARREAELLDRRIPIFSPCRPSGSTSGGSPETPKKGRSAFGELACPLCGRKSRRSMAPSVTTPTTSSETLLLVTVLSPSRSILQPRARHRSERSERWGQDGGLGEAGSPWWRSW
jgi:hypothetical protein